jgi:hypothetical protein
MCMDFMPSDTVHWALTWELRSAKHNHVLLAIGAGVSWPSEASHRLLLTVEDGSRKARIWKSSYLPPCEATFTITDTGVNDVPYAA